MASLKHTMILSGKGNEVATLSIEKKLNGVFGTIKTYNLIDKNDLVLGLSFDEKIIKQNIMLNDKDTYTFKLKDVDKLDNISSVLVRKNVDKFEPILWGKKQYKFDEILNEFNNTYIDNSRGTISTQSTTSSLFETTEKEVEELIDNEINKPEDEMVEQEVDNEEELDESDEVEDDELEKDIFQEENKKLNNLEGNQFFELISEQIDDLFENYPRVDELEELLPNSKWVKIDFENDGNEYVLGLIYDQFDLKYICYGVPGEFNSVPPKQLGECQWLPLNPKEPVDGYWVIYQDASTGEKVDVI